jgi:SOS regulatory protein LexA
MNLKDKKKKISSFYNQNKRMPTYREMMNLFNYNSKNSVHKLVKKLVNQNFVSQDNQGRLLPNQLYGQTPILGLVEAGFPTDAQEDFVDTVSLDEFLIDNKESSYLLEVKGESMKDAGILPGDLVLVEKTDQADFGRIVIAEVDGEWTMKYLQKKNGKICLMPANKKFKPIYPDNELKIAAVVKGVIRKCR